MIVSMVENIQSTSTPILKAATSHFPQGGHSVGVQLYEEIHYH